MTVKHGAELEGTGKAALCGKITRIEICKPVAGWVSLNMRQSDKSVGELILHRIAV